MEFEERLVGKMVIVLLCFAMAIVLGEVMATVDGEMLAIFVEVMAMVVEVIAIVAQVTAIVRVEVIAIVVVGVMAMVEVIVMLASKRTHFLLLLTGG